MGAAIGVTADVLDRAGALLDVGADVLVLDSAHGHSFNIINCVKKIRAAFPHAQLIAGNIATAAAAEELIAAGADALKVGIGPGSICTTRVVAGIGVPQITAIYDVACAAHRHNIPIIADGGIKYSGDIVKAIAAGADVVMAGSLLAGCEGEPRGRARFTRAAGSRSTGAWVRWPPWKRAARTAISRRTTRNWCQKGSRAACRTAARWADCVYQMMGGLRSGMGYCGTRTIPELQERGQFIRITGAGLKESHPHDIYITKEAPNYSVSP